MNCAERFLPDTPQHLTRHPFVSKGIAFLLLEMPNGWTSKQKLASLITKEFDHLYLTWTYLFFFAMTPFFSFP